MIKVQATPMGEQWAVECSVCGAVSLTASAEVDHELQTHAETHNKVAV